MGGQIVDATLVAAPKQRNTAAEKETIKEDMSAAEIWPENPTKAAQKDTDMRWTLKFAKGRPLPGGKPGIDITIPSFGYESSMRSPVIRLHSPRQGRRWRALRQPHTERRGDQR